MRVESAQRNRKAAMVLPSTNEEVIIPILVNDKAAMLAEFPDFGDKSWVNGFLSDAYVTTVIQSLPELPFPNFDNADSRSQQIVKAIDAEWKQPCVYLCFWTNISTTPTPGATTSNYGNWVYEGKIAIVHQYGYPERKYRFSDFLTDDIAAALAEGERLGVSFQWPEKLFYQTLTNVAYSDDETTGLKISTFTEQLPETTLSYGVDGFRVIDGSELPIEPIVTVTGRTLTVVFDNELRILPATIRAIVRERGSVQKLNSSDLITLKCNWKQEIISLQPDYTPTPVIVQGTVSQVVRQVDTRTFNASTTRQNALSSQPTRTLGRITNNGATNQVYYKLGSDVTVAGGLIPSGTNPASISGGYSGIIAVNGGYMDVPTGYTGIISVVTNAGVSSITATETYTVAA
jgi:hypothetical protein